MPAATEPLAPARFSMTIVCPSDCCIGPAASRAGMSAPPPGGQATTTRFGQAPPPPPWLRAAVGATRNAAAAAAVTAVCASLGKALAVPEPALGVAGRDGA